MRRLTINPIGIIPLEFRLQAGLVIVKKLKKTINHFKAMSGVTVTTDAAAKKALIKFVANITPGLIQTKQIKTVIKAFAKQFKEDTPQYSDLDIVYLLQGDPVKKVCRR
jgi:hypothetical protein